MVPKIAAAGAIAPPMIDTLDAQQTYVNSQLLPYGERLLTATDQNIELPYALYDAQKQMYVFYYGKSHNELFCISP